MPNPFVVMLCLAMGLYVIFFARHAYRNPDPWIQRWYTFLPLKAWSQNLLRGFAVFWVFGVLLMIQGGVIDSPFLRSAPRRYVWAVCVAIAVIGTVLLLPRRKRMLRKTTM